MCVHSVIYWYIRRLLLSQLYVEDVPTSIALVQWRLVWRPTAHFWCQRRVDSVIRAPWTFFCHHHTSVSLARHLCCIKNWVSRHGYASGNMFLWTKSYKYCTRKNKSHEHTTNVSISFEIGVWHVLCGVLLLLNHDQCNLTTVWLYLNKKCCVDHPPGSCVYVCLIWMYLQSRVRC